MTSWTRSFQDNKPCILIWTIFVIFLVFVVTKSQARQFSSSAVDEKSPQKTFCEPERILHAIKYLIFAVFSNVLELFLDGMTKPRKGLSEDLVERSVLGFVVLLPAFSILRIFHRIEVSYAFYCWHLFHFMGALAPVYCICCRMLSEHFGGAQLPLSYALLVSSGLVFLSNLNNHTKTWYIIVIAVTYTLSQCIFLFAVLRWLWSLYMRAKKNSTHLLSSMTENEFRCMLYVLFTMIFLTFGFSLLFISLVFNMNRKNYSEANILIGIYSFLAFSVFVSCIPGRAKQYEAKVQQQKIDAGHATVRYISHEIRSPLNIVQNGTKLIQCALKGKCSRDVFEILQDIQFASDAATCIVDDLLDFEKIQSGKFGINPKHIAASECVAKIANSCFSLAAQKGINLYMHDEIPVYRNKVYTIFADPFKFQQVVRNLIVNAIKFTPGGGAISVDMKIIKEDKSEVSGQGPIVDNSASQRTSIKSMLNTTFCQLRHPFACFSPKNNPRQVYVTEKNGQVRRKLSSLSINEVTPNSANIAESLIVEVTDTGIGMTDAQTENVFGEFVQFDPHILQGGGGSGLGLWICKEIIKAHKGTIAIQSKGPGRGTKVTLKLNVFVKDMADEHFNDKNCAQHEFVDDKLISSVKYDTACRDISNVHPTNVLLWNTSQSHFKEEDKEESEESKEKYGAAVGSQNKMRLLIVDDSALNRKVLIKMIKQMATSKFSNRSLELFEADNGMAALKIIEEEHMIEKIDAVFIDNIMPKMNGIQAAEKMRKQYNYKGRVIGVTGNAGEADVSNFILHGADVVLTKPVSWAAVQNELLSLCQEENHDTSKQENSYTSVMHSTK